MKIIKRLEQISATKQLFLLHNNFWFGGSIGVIDKHYTDYLEFRRILVSDNKRQKPEYHDLHLNPAEYPFLYYIVHYEEHQIKMKI